ncbi:MAG: 3-deoxy-8-phosphooctulonate synthase [Chitinophagaceae bacterium]|nr:MAG: 3-deoxy-8-phosphooctulonate synthase [Chitinophagaceae bacterium]
MKKPLLLIAGPCVIENKTTPLLVAEKVLEICRRLGIEYVFKSSFKKANRTNLGSFTGIEFTEAMEILSTVKKKYNIPVLTDVHETHEVKEVATVADYLQIPAFLCRQTDLLIECGKTGKWVNIKKGQFASPGSMKFAIDKVSSTGNNKILLTERGTTFGYGDLVVDFRSIPIMQSLGVPVILDATHSLQQPNQSSGITGGLPHLIETICKAGIAVGVDGLFIETHPEPSKALSDGANMLQLDLLEPLLQKLVKIRETVQ